MRLIERMIGVEEFQVVADVGSFVGASEKLGMTPSGVGKAVQRLETRLGVRLLTRTTRSVVLSEDGALFLDRCRQLSNTFDDAEAEVDARRTAISGSVRMAAPLAYGRLKIIPAMAPFLILHPDLKLDLRLSDRLQDPVEDRVDLMIRIGELEDSSMWARAIDRVRLGVFASPSYLMAHSEIIAVDDLAKHARIGFKRGSGQPLIFTLKEQNSTSSLHPTDHFQADDIDAVVAAAVNGLGLAYLPTFIANPEIEKGLLSAVLESFWIDGPPVNLVYPQPKQMPRRVRALANHLICALDN